MPLHFSFGSIVASIFVGGIGLVLFNRGRKISDSIFILFGILMMVYPCFITDVGWMMGITLSICGFLYWRSKGG